MSARPTCKQPGCGNVVLCADGYCYNHTGTVTDEERRAAKAKGGQTTAAKAAPLPMDEVLEASGVELSQAGLLEVQSEALACLRQALHRDTNDTKLASDVSSACYRLSRHLEAVDLETRLNELEKQVKEHYGQ